jgi:hypothetical protein
MFEPEAAPGSPRRQPACAYSPCGPLLSKAMWKPSIASKKTSSSTSKVSSRGHSLARVHTFQLHFNLVRPNWHKGNPSLWQIIERLAPRSPLPLCLSPPVFLDYYLNDSGGYDVPRLPISAHCVCGAFYLFERRYIRSKRL